MRCFDLFVVYLGLFTEIVTSELKLSNPTDDQIAFKVKTTAPRRYAVRPNSGVLHGGESVSVSGMESQSRNDPSKFSSFTLQVKYRWIADHNS